jgi:hypothetical protein
MKGFDRIRAVKDSARARILAIPGVHGIAIGAKVVAGTPTAELAITVFLLKKQPISEVPHEYLVPPYIDGFKTDVIEMPVPYLSQIPPVGTPSLSLFFADQHTLSITGDPVPGADWFIQINFSVGTLSSSQQLSATLFTVLGDTLDTIAMRLAGEITIKLSQAQIAGIKATASVSSAGANQVVLAVTGNQTAVFFGSPTTRLIRGTKSSPYVGGIRIEASPVKITPPGGGTLGCIMVDPTAPQQRAYALTCWHVVAPFALGTSIPNLKLLRPSPAVVTFSIDPPLDPLPPTRIVLLIASGGLPHHIFVPYVTQSSQSLQDIVNAVYSAINVALAGNAATGVTAQISGSSITLTNAIFKLGDWISTLTIADQGSVITTTVNQNTVTFSLGPVQGDTYGVYTKFDVVPAPGSNPPLPTYGVFTPLPDKTPSSAIAGLIADSINKRINNLPTYVTADPSGGVLKINNGTNLDCVVSSDVTVGQPTANEQAGMVTFARYDIDAALIQFDKGKTCDSKIPQIGSITGPYALQAADVAAPGYPVQKYGSTTQWTSGNVTNIDYDGFINISIPVKPGVVVPGAYGRSFYGAILISWTPQTMFSAGGDSGSVIVDNLSPNSAGQVIGLLFGGTTLAAAAQTPAQSVSLATPISKILDAFNIQNFPGAMIANSGPITTS